MGTTLTLMIVPLPHTHTHSLFSTLGYYKGGDRLDTVTSAPDSEMISATLTVLAL